MKTSTMKTLVVLLLLGLVCITSAGPVNPVSGDLCTSTTRMAVHKHKVRHVGMTAADSSARAIVVTTVCQKKLCLDPTWSWATNLLAKFESGADEFNKTPCTK